MTQALARTYKLTDGYGAYLTNALMLGCLFMAALYALYMYRIVSRFSNGSPVLR